MRSEKTHLTSFALRSSKSGAPPMGGLLRCPTHGFQRPFAGCREVIDAAFRNDEPPRFRVCRFIYAFAEPSAAEFSFDYQLCDACVDAAGLAADPVDFAGAESRVMQRARYVCPACAWSRLPRPAWPGLLYRREL